MLRWSTT